MSNPILHKLTQIEQRVLALAVDGMRNAEIASELHTSEQMVKNYFRNIYDITGMDHSRALLAFVYNKPDLIAELKEMIG